MNTAVLLLNEDAAMQTELEKHGFSVFPAAHPQSARQSLASVAAQNHFDFYITADPKDGFRAADIISVQSALADHPASVVIGEREMPDKRSAAASIYEFLSGVTAKDFTSSLIGLDKDTLMTMLKMKSSDGLFLRNILLEARARGIPLVNVKTEAVSDKEPGFDILKSLKLYLVFVKFSISAFIAYMVDIGTFYLFQKAFAFMDDEYKILTATVLSRILCSIATYILNKIAVFQSQAKSLGTIVRFVILAAAQLIASWLLVWWLGSLAGGGDGVNTLLKIVVDLIIFLASFTIQRDWVFKESKNLLK